MVYSMCILHVHVISLQYVAAADDDQSSRSQTNFVQVLYVQSVLSLFSYSSGKHLGILSCCFHPHNDVHHMAQWTRSIAAHTYWVLYTTQKV